MRQRRGLTTLTPVLSAAARVSTKRILWTEGVDGRQLSVVTGAVERGLETVRGPQKEVRMQASAAQGGGEG